MCLSIGEDSTGLWTVSRIVGHDKPGSLGEYRWTLIKEGVVDGLSIEFSMFGADARWMDEDEYEVERLGTPDDFWFPPREFETVPLLGYSFVDHPSDDDARIDAVRHAREIARDLKRIQVPVASPSPSTPPAPASSRSWHG